MREGEQKDAFVHETPLLIAISYRSHNLVLKRFMLSHFLLRLTFSLQLSLVLNFDYTGLV